MGKSDIANLFLSNDLSSDVIKNKSIDLAKTYLSGQWNQIDIDDIQISQITGGQSNLLYLVSSKSSNLVKFEPDCFLIRIHNQAEAKQIFTDTVVFSVLAERGLGPKLYGFFEGGRLEEYIPSTTYNEDKSQDPKNYLRIASQWAELHCIDVPISKKPGAFDIAREWLKSYKELGGVRYEIKPINAHYENGEVPDFLTVEEIESELDEFEKMSKIFDDRVVFCHNDLAPSNILERDSNNEVVFIDFEYASYNYRGFDLAVHLSEWAMDYRIDGYPGYKIHPTVCDDTPFVRPFCTAYIDKLYELKQANPHNGLPKTENRESEIDQLVNECMFFWPFVNFFWAVSAIKSVQAKYEIGIDLDGVGSDRFAIYYHLKPAAQKIYEEVSSCV